MESKLFLEKSKSVFGKMVEHRRTIHANPELSYHENKTSLYTQNFLKTLGIEFKVLNETAVVATIGNKGKCIALRADIDALPIEEETNLEFSSKKVGVMHACGHDLHISMMLGVAELLKSIEKEINGTIKIIFQNAEEKLPGGAVKLIEAGVLEDPAPMAIFGCHVFPEANTGSISIAEGNVLASADELYFTLTGKGGHAAQPHISDDLILASSELVLNLQSLISKYKNPLNPGVLSITSIHGGTATNIFPDEVKLMGTLRSFDPEWRKLMHELIISHTEKVCSLYNVTSNVRIEKGYPSLINNSKAVSVVKETAIDLLGKDLVLDFIPKMWAEDFAYYAEKIPAAFWFLGVKPENVYEMAPLHNSKFSPDENAMLNGSALMANVALNALDKF